MCLVCVKQSTVDTSLAVSTILENACSLCFYQEEKLISFENWAVVETKSGDVWASFESLTS